MTSVETDAFGSSVIGLVRAPGLGRLAGVTRSGGCDLIGPCPKGRSLFCPPDLAGHPWLTTSEGDRVRMTATRCETQVITVGVDTHQLVHHAAIVDSRLGSVADREFPATSGGFADLVDWMSRYGQVSRVGVESTGSYGAGLTRHLIGAGVEVCEIQCPATSTRRREGKSDVVDAYSAARQAATGNPDRLGMPKLSTGVVESIRLLKVPRDSAVKQRTAAYSQLRDLITTAPTPIREDLLTKTGKQRVARAIGYRPDPARLDDPTQAAKKSLRALATRIRALDIEIRDADKDLTKLTQRVAPTVLAMPQVGVQMSRVKNVAGISRFERWVSSGWRSPGGPRLDGSRPGLRAVGWCCTRSGTPRRAWRA